MPEEDITTLQNELQRVKQDLIDLKRSYDYHSHIGYDGSNKIPSNKANVTANITTVTVASYTALADDYTILCDCTSNAITINLPAAIASKYRIYNIKKIDASANGITIDGYLSETIDGAATKTTATQWTSFQIQSNGTSWYVL